MIRTYEANFSVALYSLGTDEYPIEEDDDEEPIPYAQIIASHTNNFNWCLCNDIQSNYVLKFLKEGYEEFQIYGDVTISEVKYERSGKFTCKIGIFDDPEEPYCDFDIEEIIEEVIRASELIEDNGIVINNEKYAVDIKLDYFVETYYDEEDEKCNSDEEDDEDDEEQEKEEQEKEEQEKEEQEKEEHDNKFIQEYEYNYDGDASGYNSEE